MHRYSQVHEIHPSHAFLVVPERPTRTMSEPIIKLKQPRESMISMTSIMSEDECTSSLVFAWISRSSDMLTSTQHFDTLMSNVHSKSFAMKL